MDTIVHLFAVKRIQTDIVSGYQPGDKLPSVRDLAAESIRQPEQSSKKAFAENLNAPVWSIPGGPADVLSRRDCHIDRTVKNPLATEKMEEF